LAEISATLRTFINVRKAREMPTSIAADPDAALKHGPVSVIAGNPFGLRKAAYSVNEVMEVLSIGRTSLYALVKAKKLVPHKLGRKTLFLAPDITAFLTRLREGA
jgi:excisionase family DNA binding protein